MSYSALFFTWDIRPTLTDCIIIKLKILQKWSQLKKANNVNLKEGEMILRLHELIEVAASFSQVDDLRLQVSYEGLRAELRRSPSHLHHLQKLGLGLLHGAH